MSTVNVYEGDRHEGGIIGRVTYNECLDHWDGHNHTCGSTGLHLGISRLKKSGQMVLIHGTQWQGNHDYAEAVTDQQAIQAILANNPRVMADYPHLQEIADSQLDTDEEPEAA